MKRLTVVIERNEDAIFSYVREIDGCVAGGMDFNEVKNQIDEIVKIAQEEDNEVRL